MMLNTRSNTVVTCYTYCRIVVHDIREMKTGSRATAISLTSPMWIMNYSIFSNWKIQLNAAPYFHAWLYSMRVDVTTPWEIPIQNSRFEIYGFLHLLWLINQHFGQNKNIFWHFPMNWSNQTEFVHKYRTPMFIYPIYYNSIHFNWHSLPALCTYEFFLLIYRRSILSWKESKQFRATLEFYHF